MLFLLVVDNVVVALVVVVIVVVVLASAFVVVVSFLVVVAVDFVFVVTLEVVILAAVVVVEVVFVVVISGVVFAAEVRTGAVVINSDVCIRLVFILTPEVKCKNILVIVLKITIHAMFGTVGDILTTLWGSRYQKIKAQAAVRQLYLLAPSGALIAIPTYY